MTVLKLKVGDRVRNINTRTERRGWTGVMIQHVGIDYLVRYGNGTEQRYSMENAHNFLEKIEDPNHDYRSQYRKALSFALAYTGGVFPSNQQERTILKKVRRNVITGKTQDDMVKELGAARGVQQFNTRALGTTTGQAFRVIGDAMCNPDTEIRISKVDHAKDNELCSTSWTTLDKHFRHVVQELIGERKGFTFTPTHIMFNPIVTEETYVTRSH